MNKKLLNSCIGLALLASQAQADYLVDLQLGLSSSSGEIEFDDYPFDDIDTEGNGANIGGTVFFNRVSTENVPIREAAFLSQLSSVNVEHNTADVDYETGFGDDITIKTKSTELNGRFVIPGPRIILIAGLAKGESEIDELSGSTVDVDSYQLGGGWYITDQSSLTATYTKSEYELDGASVDIEDSDSIDITYRQVFNLGSRSHLAFYATVGTFDDGEDYDETNVGGGVTWYPNNKLGVGAKILATSGEGDYYEDSSLEFSPYISYDFSENFGLYGELNLFAEETDSDFSDDSEYTATGITIGANARF